MKDPCQFDTVRVSIDQGDYMPFIQVTMLEGRTVEQKKELISKLNSAAAEVLGGDPSRIRIALYEVSGDDWGIGGETINALNAGS
ncbi:MAG: 4-oxalocrotonate tautomerase family protein [Actinomycetota bacterium]|nr:4-oxalocrotonate tautomerase family protein [Actinomycetota bacterium]